MSQLNKRYQVFVSSTYADLKDERSRVIQTLMEMDCIPSGMELFPAADEEQFEFIKRIIDDCDYYLLIIGGRYGSTTEEGISYTEKEYDYAIQKGLKVIALLHGQPDDIPVGKTDKNAALAERLEAFRAKVETNRLVKYWKTAEELPGIVSLSLSKTIKTYPATGWVRGGGAASSEILEELNEVRKQNDELRTLLAKFADQDNPKMTDIAGIDDAFQISGDYRPNFNSTSHSWKTSSTFGKLFALIAPHLISHPTDSVVNNKLAHAILKSQGHAFYSGNVDDQIFQTLKIQLKALGLVNISYNKTTKGGMALFWTLTSKGERLMTELRVVRKSG